MKKLIAIAIAAASVMMLGDGSPLAIPQEGQEPTLCELLAQTRDKACEEAKIAQEEAGDDPAANRRAWRLEELCIRLEVDHTELCADPE